MIFEKEKQTHLEETEKYTSYLYDGKYIVIFWKEGVDIEKEDAHQAMDQGESLAQDGVKPTFVELSLIRSMPNEAREVFQTRNVNTSSALALVVASTLSRVIGNIFISMNDSGIPVKLFNSQNLAMEWLRKYD